MKLKSSSVITALCLLAALAFAVPARAADPLPNPSWMQDVYGISPYGDVPRMNPLWWAEGDTAILLSRALGGVAVASETSPQTGPPLKRWHVAHVPANLIPPMGQRISNPTTLMRLLDLPTALMYVTRFADGCTVNTGYLADYVRRNKIAADGGIGAAQRAARGECNPPGFAVQAVTAPVRGVKRLLGKHKYPSLTADGKKLPRLPRGTRW